MISKHITFSPVKMIIAAATVEIIITRVQGAIIDGAIW